MGTRAAQTDPGDDRRSQRIHSRHARTDSADSQATAVDDDAQLVLDAKRPRKRAVDEDGADEVLEAKRLRVTPGTATEPTDAQTESPEAAALHVVPNFTAATPAVVADRNQRKQHISQLLCGIVHAVDASAPPLVPDRIAAANESTSVKRQVTAAQVAAQDEHERHDAALPVQTVNAVPASVRPAAPSAAPVLPGRIAAANKYTSVERRATAAQVAAQDERERPEAALPAQTGNAVAASAAPRTPPRLPDRIAAANKYTSVERRATAAQVAAQNERERQQAAERARVEEIACRCLPVSATDAKDVRAPLVNVNTVHSRPPRFRALQAGDNGVNNWLAVAEDKNLINRNHSHLACIEKGGDCADYDVAPCPCCVDEEETERLRYKVALALAPSFL